MWYLIVSIPDLCTLTYFAIKMDLENDRTVIMGITEAFNLTSSVNYCIPIDLNE